VLLFSGRARAGPKSPAQIPSTSRGYVGSSVQDGLINECEKLFMGVNTKQNVLR
jgi:hypothetical protein